MGVGRAPHATFPPGRYHDGPQGGTALSPALAGLVLSKFAPEADDGTEGMTTLTTCQRKVLKLVALGGEVSNKYSTGALHAGETTALCHVSQILEHLCLQSRHQMAEYAQERVPASPLDNK